MGRVANQQTFIITKKVKEPFLSVTKEDLFKASQELNGNAFKLYLYLAANKDGYEFDFSTAHFAQSMGVGNDSKISKRAKEELIEKKYLKEENGKFVFSANGF